MIARLKEPKHAAYLYEGWQDGSLRSCLQGVMGQVYGNDQLQPTAARAILGDFSFFAGEPEEELLRLESDREFHILVPVTEGWKELIESCFGERVKPVTRYAIKKEPGIFDREKLKKAAASLPSGYQLRFIDEELYEACRREEWSRDFVANYPDYETFSRLGLGVLALKDGKPAAGSSSYSTCLDGIEIEVVTEESHRRKRLAYACCAALILACLDRGLYPSWDARTLYSVGLAEKLGYHMAHPYRVYDFFGGTDI